MPQTKSLSDVPMVNTADNQINGYLQQLQEHLTVLAGEARDSGSRLLVGTLAELNLTVEELMVAEEELHVQHEQMSAAMQQADYERLRYQDLFEAAPDPYLVTDLFGVIQEANQAATRLLGIKPQFVIGKPLANLVPDEDRRAFRQHVRDIQQSLQPQEREIRIKPRHNPVTTMSAMISIVRDERRQAHSLRWLLREVTTQRPADPMPAGSSPELAIITVDADRIVTGWSAGAERLLMYPAGQMIGQSSALFLIPAESSAASAQSPDTQCFLRQNGSMVWGALSQTPLLDATGASTGYIMVLHEILNSK